MKKHTIQELASDRELWREYIDPNDNAPFEQFTQEEREDMIRRMFGEDGNGHPYL